MIILLYLGDYLIWLERFIDVEEVRGSNPLLPTRYDTQASSIVDEAFLLLTIHTLTLFDKYVKI